MLMRVIIIVLLAVSTAYFSYDYHNVKRRLDAWEGMKLMSDRLAALKDQLLRIRRLDVTGVVACAVAALVLTVTMVLGR